MRLSWVLWTDALLLISRIYRGLRRTARQINFTITDANMKNVLFLLTALFAFVFTTEAKANDGVYVNLFAGPNWLDCSKKGHRGCDSSSIDGRRHRRLKAKFDTGFVVGGAVGYQGCGCFRGEFEIAYRENQLKKTHDRRRHSSVCDSIVSIPSFDRRHRIKGHFESLAFMLNAYYDMPMECSCWGFYVGGGLGYVDQKFKFKRKRHHHDSCDSIIVLGLDDSSSDFHRRRPSHKKEHFAAQGILGLSYTFCECMFFDVEYRFFYLKNCNNNALVIGLRSGF
jgi:opacity protein-like surface antigen